MNTIDMPEAPTQDVGQQMQLVKALSALGDMPELSAQTDVATVLKEIKKAQAGLANTSSTLEVQRSAHAGKSWWNILDDSESRVRDAQLNMSAAMGELGAQSTKLLLFNTAISKVICDLQGLLLKQQGALDLQTRRIEDQNEEILENSRELKKLYSSRDEVARAQDAFAARVTQIMVSIDASQEDVHRRLADGIGHLETVRERVEKLDASLNSALGRLAGVEAGSARDVQELRLALDSRMSELVRIAAERECGIVEQTRQDTASAVEAVGSRLTQLQARCRSQGRLVVGMGLFLAASMSIAVVVFASHLPHG